VTRAPRQPPYPPSELIAAWEWDPPETILRAGIGPIVNMETGGRDGSDNWPITWADDDRLYVAYGDGYGFEPYVGEKLGMGFGRITGWPATMQAENIRSETGENRGYGESGKKGSGLVMVDGVLYLWLFHADQEGSQAQLAVSRDLARTWEACEWRFAEFGLCAFVNFGRNYEGARDGYVYTVSHDGPRANQPADRMILMRAPVDGITERRLYTFFAGLDGDGRPQWSSDIAARASVFDHRGSCLRSGISYCAPLGRYLWWQHIPQPAGHRDRGDTRFDGGFGIYEAPELWGPWRTAYFTEEWDVGPGERADFPTKWMSPDGCELYMVFSGSDNFCVRRAALTVATPSP